MEPRFGKSVRGALTCHRESNSRHLLHHAFRRLCVDRERRRLIRSDFDAGDLSLRHGARGNRLPHLLILPCDQLCQGAGVEVSRGLTLVSPYSLSVIRRIQQTANSRSKGSELASKDRMSFSVWGYQALVLTYGITISRTSSGSAQLTEDVVRLVHQSMFHLDAEEYRKVNANAETHQSPASQGASQ